MKDERWGAINLNWFWGLVKPTSPEACEFFKSMTEEQWEEWQPRYHTLILCDKNHKPRPGVDKSLNTPITWWEREFYTAYLMGFLCAAEIVHPDPRKQN